MQTATSSATSNLTPRQEAISYVAEQLAQTQKSWAHVDRDEFVQQLMERVQHPKKINQGSTDFCGPAAALYALAKDDPKAYAKFALDLFFTGKASVRGWNAEAGSLANEKVPPEKKIGACDWVTMACLRRNVGFGALTAVTNIAQGTLPFEIAKCFERFGYQTVKNETYSTFVWKADEKNLQEASDLWVKDYRVVLCVNTNMFKDPTEKAVKPNHFCTLKSKVRIAKNISCRVWQWGNDNKEPTTAGSEIYVDLPRDQFMMQYFGYVAAGDLKKD